jgi:hypothetical protein
MTYPFDPNAGIGQSGRSNIPSRIVHEKDMMAEEDETRRGSVLVCEGEYHVVR